MKLFDTIKQKFGLYKLRKEAANQRSMRAFNNFETAKTVGILFDATHQESYLIAKSFIASIRLKNVEVEALGYVKTRDAITYYPHHKGTDFFSISEVNWYFRPKGQSIDNFCNKRFDILIDLTMEDLLSLKYIVVYSKSAMKVGIGAPENIFYDFSLDLKRDSRLEFYIHQINYYMSVLKKAS